MKKCAALSRCYRVIWNRSRGEWAVASERAGGFGKGGGRSKAKHSLKGWLLLVPLAMLTASVLAASIFPQGSMAAPVGGQVTAGQGHITQRGNTTTIHQSSQHLSLNWKRFNIAPIETVNFRQPGASAVAVNRISDINGSRIMGHLNANGQVYLINPNGILFGKSAQVNVGGLVASTLDIPDTALGNANQTFAGTGTGEIINNGTIHASNGGYVALLGNRVSNNGIITARLGTVAMGAGNQMTLTFNGNRLLKLRVDKSVLDSLAANHGLIRADGGIVAMNAGARDSLLASVVNNDGIIQAQTVQNHNGKIVLLGGMQAGTTQVAGTLDASAPTRGSGGFIETSAAHVKVANSVKITTKATHGQNGTWLIDPTDFTIAATGDISGSTLSTSLGAGSVTIKSTTGASGTTGDINVNDTVTWNANTLTLNAQNNININSVMNGSGAATLALQYGQGAVAAGNTSTYNVNAAVNLAAGNHFSTQLGSNGTATNYTVITTLGTQGSIKKTDLQGMNGNLAGHYALGANIDATATGTWNTAAGFAPVGDSYSSSFTGSFDGLGHTISNLTINRPGQSNVGLFGYGTGAIRNIGMVGGSVTGGSQVGGLVGVGYGSRSTITNSYATGNVTGAGDNVGGLVGYANRSTITNSYATGSVTGAKDVGGLVGYGSGSPITNSYATGNVTGTGDNVGGLVGNDRGSTITNSYATGNVAGATYVGGLVGYDDGSISNSYATGSVTGASQVGGLVGYGGGHGSISNSYATGSVTGASQVGGLVGYGSGTITNSHATGSVTGTGNKVGGLVGYDKGSISNSYATGNVTGTGNKVGGLVGYGYGSISNSYATGSVTGASQVGGLVGYNYGSISNSYATGSVTGTTSVGGLVGKKASTNSTVSSSFWDITTSGQTISAGGTGMTTAEMQRQTNFTSATAANGNANPAPAWDFSTIWVMYNGHSAPLLRALMTPLTVTANSVKTYDGVAFSGGNPGYSITPTPTANLFGTVTFSGSSQGAVNAGTYAITPSGLYSNQQGFVISYASGSLTVNPATLSASGTRVYNGTTSFGGAGLTVTGVGGETFTASGNGTLLSKNVQTNKALASLAGLTLSGNSGALLSNYKTFSTGNTSVSVAKASISAVTGIAASNKVYNANTAATLNNAAAGFTGKLAGDLLTVASATGVFANKNVGTGTNVSISGITLGGTDSGNYNLTSTTAATTADITPAALTYSATPVRIIQAQPLPVFGGTVTGFVAGDTLASSTTGTLAWASPATSSNTPGSFAIDGGGLTATNYLFSQAGGNATALTIQPGRADSSVESTVTQAESLANPGSRTTNTNVRVTRRLTTFQPSYGGAYSSHVYLKVKGDGIRLPRLFGHGRDE